ncbi:MAG: pyrroloquinoline quinone precursor peptide PqqA [Pseudomonadota bacterium]
MLQWAKPVITVQNVGMEVTSYAPADMDERDTGI